MLSAQQYAGNSGDSSCIIPSRSTLASTLAAATEEQRRSALIMVRTGGQTGAPSISWNSPSPLRVGQPVVVAVEQDHVGYGGQLGQGAATGRAERSEHPDRVDLVRAGVADRPGRGPAADPRHQPLAHVRGQQLGVADARRAPYRHRH